VLTVLSAAGGSSFITVPTTGIPAAVLFPATTTITLQVPATTAAINPLPMWNQTTNAVVSCTGYTALTYTGCSSAPANGTVLTSAALSNAGTGLLGGWIKIEVASAAVPPVWTDVTAQILNWGIGGPSLGPDGTITPYGPNPAIAAGACPDPTPNAILRLQRLRDNGTAAAGGCNYQTDVTGAKDPTSWWPNVLFDTREALQRDADPGTAPNLPYGGVIYYVALDAKNLAKWFKNVAPYNAPVPVAAPLGNTARTDNGGYTVYFSDRRNNRNAASAETAEYGWEDFVNPTVVGGVPNNALDLPGEDVNGNTTFEVYGQFPNYNGVYNAAPPGAAAPLNAGGAPVLPVRLVSPAVAKVNRPIIFRRALKLINGSTLGSDAVVANRITGLTVVSENPVYLKGDWNAFDAASFAVGALHAATAVIADAVTILSNTWNDNNSLAFPYSPPNRLRGPNNSNSYYRVAVLGGQGPTFARPTSADVPAASVLGTDGGAHNFLRMLEGGNGTANVVTVNYRGSMATLFYNRQAVGTFKCCSGTLQDGVVYAVPIRNFIFDTDFIVPGLLPPNTPMFRDMNVVGFSQELRPGK